MSVFCLTVATSCKSRESSPNLQPVESGSAFPETQSALPAQIFDAERFSQKVGLDYRVISAAEIDDKNEGKAPDRITVYTVSRKDGRTYTFEVRRQNYEILSRKLRPGRAAATPEEVAYAFSIAERHKAFEPLPKGETEWEGGIAIKTPEGLPEDGRYVNVHLLEKTNRWERPIANIVVDVTRGKVVVWHKLRHIR